MVKRLHWPYWANWVGWQVYHRHRRKRAAARRATWDFLKLVQTLPPGSLAIDGGANIGNVTAALARRGIEVHAFEPDPFAAAIFAERFRGKPNVHLHRQALGARPDRAVLYRTVGFDARPLAHSTASSLIQRGAHDAAGAAEVEVVDLVQFIRGLGRRVDILKLDVEGSEADILERILDEGLDREIGAIFIETHESFSADLAERIAALRKRVKAAGTRNINLDWI